MALPAPQIERLGRELAKVSSSPEASSATLLKMLDEINKGVGAKATEDLLRSTKIGVVVNKLKANRDIAVAKAAGDLVSRWRDQVKSASKKSGGGATPTNGTTELKRESNGAGTPLAAVKSASPAAAVNGVKAVPPEQRTAKTDGVNTAVTDNDVRNNCLRLMYDGLANMSDAATDLILQLAIQIESAAYTLDPPATSTEAASDAYKAKMRSLYQNLKSKSNPMLRQRVISGEVMPERFVRLTPDELKSPERLEEEKRMRKENMDKAMVAQVERSISSSLTCGKCHEKKVSYTQAQTRSADESMTTFCECTVCGNRWKFC